MSRAGKTGLLILITSFILLGTFGFNYIWNENKWDITSHISNTVAIIISSIPIIYSLILVITYNFIGEYRRTEKFILSGLILLVIVGTVGGIEWAISANKLSNTYSLVSLGIMILGNLTLMALIISEFKQRHSGNMPIW